MTTHPQHLFFLGGHDLEMVTIRDLLVAEKVPFHDAGLRWGARLSAYRDKVRVAITGSTTLALVELQIDMDLPPERIVVVDHHGPTAGIDKRTSLEQVFAMLHLPGQRWTRMHQLVAANDRGHIRGMLTLDPPATHDELVRVREADRKAQGVSAEEEKQAIAAIARSRTRANGLLTVIDLPHDRTSPAADRMERVLGGPGYRNLLVVTPQANHFFGEGRIVHSLAEAYPDGWYGGSLPEYGFWGREGQIAGLEDILELWIQAN